MLKELKIIYIVCLLAILIISCKKEVPVTPTPTPPVQPVPRTEEQLIKDSIYYYFKLYSLWEESIPTYKDISKFTDTISTSQAVLNNLKAKTPAYAAYAAYGGHYDRFSYFSDLDNVTGATSFLKMDKADGYGIFISMGTIDSETAYPFIHMVEGGSPASLVGLRRSDMILSLNNEDMKIAVTCTNGSCKAADPQKYNSILSTIRTALSASSMKIKVERNDNTVHSYDLIYKTYEVDPLLLDTVFKFSNKNVGYFAYSSFDQIKNDNGTFNENHQKLEQLFVNFSNQNIKDLIVDLRYNGGGYVDAATYLADKIINSAGKGKLMLEYQLNPYLTRWKSTSNNFNDVYFSKNNNLELETVCFIVSENTASASEMLINVLKPYMNVKIVAEESATYGKPVGFFEQKIMNKIGLWVTSFKLLNGKGETDYWQGLTADKKNVTDYIFLDFGDKDERMIAAALTYTGANTSSPLKASMQSSARSSSRVMKKFGVVNQTEHKGAIK